jgi:hypothetical protein
LSRVCDLNKPIALLEFASGFGCVTRHLKKALPRSTIAACDIQPAAIRFLRERIDTEAIQSNAVPEQLNVGRMFDVVFALSRALAAATRIGRDVRWLFDLHHARRGDTRAFSRIFSSTRKGSSSILRASTRTWPPPGTEPRLAIRGTC